MERGAKVLLELASRNGSLLRDYLKGGWWGKGEAGVKKESLNQGARDIKKEA